LFETLTAFVALDGRVIPSGYVIFRRKEQPDETIKRKIHRALIITSQYKNKLHLENNIFFIGLFLSCNPKMEGKGMK
jgi:hypothetical protein